MMEQPTWARLDDEQFLLLLEHAKREAEQGQVFYNRLEQEARRRMLERGATSIPSPDFVCELKENISYDQSRLVPLREMLLDADLEEAWIPESVKTVPGRWDMTRVKKFARKYGDEVTRLVDGARYVDGVKVLFKRRETQ